MTAPATALSIAGLTKSFAGIRVLTDVHLNLLPGEVHALVGENGSGKSTLVKILAGVHDTDQGAVTVAGQSLRLGDPGASDLVGLRFVHQDLGLIGNLDCLDNLALGPGYRVGRGGLISWQREADDARSALGRLGYAIDVRRKVASLSMSERTAVAVARALSPRRAAPNVLVLDEPTASLPALEVERLFATVRRVRDTGVAVLFISHHFNEIFSLADRVTVLRDGGIVATRDVTDLDDHQLVELMIGRRLQPPAQRSAAGPGSSERILEVRGLMGEAVRGLDLEVHAGEVVGIAGITGSGREEVARLLSGDVARDGSVTVAGAVLPPSRPDRCIAMGVACVPAERQANAALHDHDVRENLTISRLGTYVHAGLLRRSRELSDVRALLETFDVRPRDPGMPLSALSGGNQQKVMLARAMRLRPKLLVLDEPTQGVDVGAQAEIHRLIRGAVAAGLAVLVCSSVSEELAELADRVVVLVGGRATAHLRGPLDADQITAATLTTREDAHS